MNQSIKHLYYFERIAAHQSLSAAAEELNISQPALTAALQKFEANLEFDLFNRDGGRLTLNSSGKALLPRIQDLLESHHQIVDKAVDIQSQKTQSITAYINSAPWALKLKMQAIATPNLILNGTNCLTILKQQTNLTSSLGIVNYFDPFVSRAGLKHQGAFSINQYTLLFPTNLDSNEICSSINTRIVMPSNSLIAGIEERSTSIAKLFKLDHLDIFHFDCFDTMISSCSLSQNIVIVPGKKALWHELYGRLLKCEKTVTSRNSALRLYVGIAYTDDIDKTLIDSLIGHQDQLTESNSPDIKFTPKRN